MPSRRVRFSLGGHFTEAVAWTDFTVPRYAIKLETVLLFETKASRRYLQICSAGNTALVYVHTVVFLFDMWKVVLGQACTV